MRAAFRAALLTLAVREGTDAGAPSYLLVTRLIADELTPARFGHWGAGAV
jgi:hypothetical protein